MRDLAQLLAERGIETAVIIDDVFDAVPTSDDLNDDDWTIFFDDLDTDAHNYLAQIYPRYEDTPSVDLMQSQPFIQIVWDNRQKLPSTGSLFRGYEFRNTTERQGLDQLVGSLERLNLNCTTMGRTIVDVAEAADLIFIDLFLGYQQSENDVEHAVDRVKQLIKTRRDDPPLVVLMSRSPRLSEWRDHFRDNAGLLGSTFRVVSKGELANDGTLETILSRLARHYNDAKRVARFIHAWNSNLDNARKQFIRIFQRLDLPDLAQIRTLLLDFDGQDLGEYLLDVADRVLQHEIEADNGTITAARELNRVNLDQYPAPHLAGSSDLQDLVYRMVFFHPDRLHPLECSQPVQLQFGDLLRWRNIDGTTFSNEVSLVVSPACDLSATTATVAYCFFRGN